MSMMIQLLFSLTVTGSIIVVCLFVLRLLLPNANSIKWHYRIGKMAIVFNLLPIALLFQWVSTLFTLKAITTVSSIEEWKSSTPYVPHLQSVPFSISSNITILLIIMWGVGFITFSAWQVYCYLKFLKELKYTNTPVSEYTEVAKQLVWIKGTLGIKKDVRLAYSSVVRSPILIGLRKPTIYLPKENSADVDMRMVLHIS
nr:M56 family metallopeptidase [Oceanobacillus sp. AG]